MTDKAFRLLFELVYKKQKSLTTLRGKFNAEIEERFGTHYSDEDDDSLIECLDYGAPGLSFDEFMDAMEKYGKANK